MAFTGPGGGAPRNGWGVGLLHPIPLFCVSYILGGLLLDLADIVASHSVAWWDQPNAVILGGGATAFVAYVIVITEILRDVRYQERHSEDRPTEIMGDLIDP
jgi:hypothetical protein